MSCTELEAIDRLFHRSRERKARRQEQFGAVADNSAGFTKTALKVPDQPLRRLDKVRLPLGAAAVPASFPNDLCYEAHGVVRTDLANVTAVDVIARGRGNEISGPERR